jgi:TP901 family phage tail tape measure protein
MAEDANARIRVDIDTAAALASIKNLQRQISAFHTNMAKGGAAAAATSLNLQQGLLNSINRTGQFSATIKNVKSTTESFTSALEKNKLSMREYFRYSAASTKSFGRFFTTEFDTINKVARERVKDLQTQYIKMGRDANGAIRAIAVRPLALDMESLSTKTQIAAQKQALLNQMLKQGSTNLLNFGKNTQWAGRQLMVGFTIPLTMFGTVAVKTFMEIEKQAIRFKRVYGEMFTTTEQTTKALNEIKNLAAEFTKYGVAVSKTMELAADIAATGKMGAELTAQVAQATRLAVLGGVEQAEALKATISLTDAFGVSAEELAGKINFLNAVENQTVTSIEDLTIAIPKAGPVVQQLGGDVQDLTFFLTAMREGGINASEGANALKSGLAALINPTGKASEMLQGFGINIKGIVDANKGNVKGIVVDFAKALDTLDPLNRAQAIEQLFGKFQFARLSTLFQNVIKEGNQASRVLKLTNATTEELAVLAERELKKVEDSPMFKFQKAIEDIKVTLVPLGEAFLKAVTPVLEFGTKILEKFNELDAGAKSFVVGLTAVAGVIGPVFLMGFGLIANGVANVIKMFTFFKTAINKTGTASTELGMQTDYMTQQQLEASAVAASLNQIHQKLTQTFTSEAAAINNLSIAYRKALAAQNGMSGGAVARTRPPKKFASGVMSVPGPKGAGDVVPAMLSPGEAVIPAKQAQKYAPFIKDMISGNVPGFRNGVFLGMPKSSKSVTKSRSAADEIYELFKKSSYVNTPPTVYGHQISPTSGHSFPIFGLGGVYQKGNKQVFVKPVMDEKAALAEIRATTIARQAHGLKSPNQRVVVIRDPMDVKRQRKFLALESDLDPTFVNNQPLGVFNEEQYFKQLTASLLRGDKDLSASNVYKDVLADVGPAGVFDRASGLRDYSKNIASMEEQALINLLGVRGGAKRAFAESTLNLMDKLTPQQYHQKMIGEIQRVLPKLKQTIASFKLTNPADVGMYDDMVRRLEAGLNVDWSKFHSIHSAVKIPKPKAPKVEGYAKGVVSVPGPKGAGDIMPAMLSPGEAVIPTKIAKKYAPLISGMIADNIPGFEEGKGYKYDPLEKTVETHLQEPSTVIRGTPGYNPELAEKLAASTPIRQMDIEGQARVSAYGDLFANLPRSLNENLKRDAGVAIEEFEKAWDGTSNKFTKTLKKGYKDLGMAFDPKNPIIASEIADMEKSIKDNVRKLAQKNGGIVNDTIVSQATAQAVQTGASRGSNVAKALRSRANSLREYRTNYTAEELRSGVKSGNFKIEDAQGGGGKIIDPKSGMTIGRVDSRTNRTRQQQMLDYKSSAAAGRPLLPGEIGPQSERDSYVDTMGLRSDSKKTTYKAGQSQAQEMVDGQASILQDEKNDPVNVQRSPKKGKPHPQAEIDGKNDARARVAAQRKEFANLTKEEKYVRSLESNYGGAQVVTPEMRGERKQVEKLMKQDRVRASQAKARAVEVANQQRVAAASNQALYGTTDFAPEMRQERKRQEAAAKAANAQAATQRKNLARENAAAAQVQRQAAASPQAATTTPGPRRSGMGMGGMAMVASGALMAGSMAPGSVGEISQQLMMPAMLASMILPMAGAFAPVIAGLGALAAGAWALKNAFDSAEKSARENALATGSGTDAIKSFAEFAGTASAGEIMDKKRSGALEQFGIQSGKESFGNLFLQSEAAKPLLEGLKASVASGATKESMVAGTKNQLATAVASGALTRDEAASIAGSLGEAIGDRSFGIKVVGELNALVGIDGRNLLESPIDIRVRLVEETNSKLQGMAQSSVIPNAQGQVLGGGALAAGGGIAGGLFGAAKGAAAGAQVVSMVGALANAGKVANLVAKIGSFGGPIGAVAGAVVGAATGAVMLYDGMKKAGAAAGAMNAQGIIGLQQNQEMLDSLDLEYQKRIDIAKAAGDLVTANRLAKELEQGRGELLAASQNTMKILTEQYNAAGPDIFGMNTMRTSLDTALNSMYKDNPLMQQVMAGSKSAIEGSSATGEQQYNLKLMLASGNVDPGTMANLLGVFGNDQETIQKIIDISLKLGTADAGRAFALADLFKDEGVKADFIAKVQTKTAPQAQKLLTMFETVQQSGGVLDMEMVLTAYMADETAGNQLLQDLEEFKAAQEAGPITTAVINNVFGKDAMDAVMKDWEYFSGLDKDMQLTYMTLVQTAFETVENNPGAYDTWAAVQRTSGKDDSRSAYLASVGNQGTTAKARTDSMTKETETPSSSGGRQADPLDNILKSLQNVRKASIDAFGGTKELFRLFENGKNISAFNGIENQLLALTSNTDFASFISGLDKKEQDLFITIKKGNVELTQRGRLLEKAYQANSIGNFVLSQQKLVISSKNELIARNLLIDAGYSYIEASELARDATIREAYADAASIKNKKDRAEAIRNLNKALKEGADAQKANRTFEEIFDDGFGKAMEAFEAQEKKLTLEFDVKVKADKEIIEAAQNEIAKIQYQIDDYEADLKGVEDQETKINKTYDDKLDALEKVKNANQKILDQEKGKLSIAEAITRGDLYAAAQAAQRVRETSASGYFGSQTSALQAARESALEQVRSKSGLSRIQIEEKIKELSNQIFSIEETRLEPAAERVRLAEVELQKRIAEITVLGNTKAQWEGIKNGIDLAKVNSDAYKKSIEEALAVVEKLKLAWAGVGPPKDEPLVVDDKDEKDNKDEKVQNRGIVTVKDPVVQDPKFTKAQIEAKERAAEQAKKNQATATNVKASVGAPALNDPLGLSKIIPPSIIKSVNDWGKGVQTSVVNAFKSILPKPAPAPAPKAAPKPSPAPAPKAAPKPSGPAPGRSIRSYMAGGGLVNYMSNGGAPKFARPSWAKTMGTDRIPTMLTPGEFVISRPAVSKIGVKSLNSMNNGEYPGSSVYNYNLSVNVSSVSDPNAIAQTVMSHIRKVESQRIRSNKF